MLQIPFPGVSQDVEVVQVFREIVPGEVDRLLFMGDHPGKVSGGKIGLCPCVMRKRDGFVQAKNPVGQRPQVLVGGIREKVRQSRGIGRVNAHGVSRFPKIVQEGSSPDPQGEQSRDGENSNAQTANGSARRNRLLCLRLNIQHQEEQQGDGHKLRVEIQKAVKHKNGKKKLSAEAPFAGAEPAPQRPQKERRRDPADVEKKLKQLVVNMLHGIDPRLKRALEAAVARITEAEGVAENDGKRVTGIEKPPDKFRGCERHGQKAADASAVPAEKDVKNTAEKYQSGENQDMQAGLF